jgi:hypothetical protein
VFKKLTSSLTFCEDSGGKNKGKLLENQLLQPAREHPQTAHRSNGENYYLITRNSRDKAASRDLLRKIRYFYPKANLGATQ